MSTVTRHFLCLTNAEGQGLMAQCTSLSAEETVSRNGLINRTGVSRKFNEKANTGTCPTGIYSASINGNLIMAAVCLGSRGRWWAWQMASMKEHYR